MQSNNIDFSSAEFLSEHIRSILGFYQDRALDESGGFYQNYYDDGARFELDKRHLVSSTRFVYMFCKAYELFGDGKYKQLAEHGFKYVQQRHWDEGRQAYHWTLSGEHEAQDKANHCYGLAFVVLASAAAHQAGIEGAEQELKKAFDLAETHFWQNSVGMYADEASEDWTAISTYRGQNANMHFCEAMLAAYQATRDEQYLDRAYQIAKTIAVTLAQKSEGLIWEHFDTELNIDWDYNKNDPKNLYRPWGFQPGHQTEWTKLLLTLYQYRQEDWILERAKFLFDKAVTTSWDEENGGLYYGFAPDGSVCDDEKYFWVQAESFAAAARLAKFTQNKEYQQWYQKIWEYCWEHFVDHQYGAWYRVLSADNQRLSNKKSEAGAKCDYHNLGACFDVLSLSEIKAS